MRAFRADSGQKLVDVGNTQGFLAYVDKSRLDSDRFSVDFDQSRSDFDQAQAYLDCVRAASWPNSSYDDGTGFVQAQVGNVLGLEMGDLEDVRIEGGIKLEGRFGGELGDHPGGTTRAAAYALLVPSSSSVCCSPTRPPSAALSGLPVRPHPPAVAGSHAWQIRVSRSA